MLDINVSLKAGQLCGSSAGVLMGVHKELKSESHQTFSSGPGLAFYCSKIRQFLSDCMRLIRLCSSYIEIAGLAQNVWLKKKKSTEMILYRIFDEYGINFLKDQECHPWIFSKGKHLSSNKQQNSLLCPMARSS